MKFKQLPWCPLTPLAPDLKKSGFSGDDLKHLKLITKLQNISIALSQLQTLHSDLLVHIPFHGVLRYRISIKMHSNKKV